MLAPFRCLRWARSRSRWEADQVLATRIYYDNFFNKIFLERRRGNFCDLIPARFSCVCGTASKMNKFECMAAQRVFIHEKLAFLDNEKRTHVLQLHDLSKFVTILIMIP